MKLVIEVNNHTGDGSVIHHTITSATPTNIGRGYDNDIIIADPHVSAHHMEITHDGAQWQARDTGSENGLLLNDKILPSKTAVEIRSGDCLKIGTTDIRIFAPEHPVAAAIRIVRASPLFEWLARPRNAWSAFLLSIAAASGFTYTEVWSDEAGVTVAAAAAGTVMVVFIWSLVWSAAGRLIKHKPHFTSHVGLFSLYLIAMTGFYFIGNYLSFLTNESMLSEIFSVTVSFSVVTILVYGALSLSTRMTKKRRATAAAWFTGGMLGSIILLGYVGTRNFSPVPPYSVVLEPYLVELARAETVESFMTENAKLFDSDTLKKAPEKQKKKEEEAASKAAPVTPPAENTKPEPEAEIEPEIAE